MNCPEETRQKLWELIYDLLPPEEAQELCDRITSDPLVARAYAEAKLRADLLAAAARHEEDRLPLATPGEGKVAAQPAASARPAVRRPSAGAARVVNLLSSLAALLLVTLCVYGCFQYGSGWAARSLKSEQDELGMQFVRLVAAGPANLDPVTDNTYSVSTLAVDGTPLSVDVNFVCEDENGVALFQTKQRTDENGQSAFIGFGRRCDQRSLGRRFEQDAPKGPLRGGRAVARGKGGS
jgi:hypothetical protein